MDDDHFPVSLSSSPTNSTGLTENLHAELWETVQKSFITSMGFFLAFLISWFISLPSTEGVLNCIFGFVGCESECGNQCCADESPEHSEELVIDETSSLMSAGKNEPLHDETIFMGYSSRHSPGLRTKQPHDHTKVDLSRAIPGGAGPVVISTHGGLGIFMMMVEFLDAVPEAAVIAIYVLDDTINYSLVVSIFMLNVTSGLASFTDLISAGSDLPAKYQPHVLFLSATLASGMLVFSVSVDIYGKFEHEYDSGLRTKFQLMLLVSGTLLGACLVLFLMWLHNSRLAARIRQRIKGFFSCCCSTASSSWSCSGGLMSCVLVTLLVLWTIAASALFCLLFYGLYDNWTIEDKHSGISFIEGLSGGAFIVTVGGTLIPYSQLGARGIKNWGKTRKAVVASVTFLLGLMGGELLGTLL